MSTIESQYCRNCSRSCGLRFSATSNAMSLVLGNMQLGPTFISRIWWRSVKCR
jgi:hypothetical protein